MGLGSSPHPPKPPFITILGAEKNHWVVFERYWMKLIECWTWALNRRSKRSCSMFQEVGTPCSSPPHGPGRPGNFSRRWRVRWRHVVQCFLRRVRRAPWKLRKFWIIPCFQHLSSQKRMAKGDLALKHIETAVTLTSPLEPAWVEEVRQLASTILYQPARVMIGNRDELKANQDQRGRDAVGIVCPLAIKAESGTSTTCIYTCPYFSGGGVYVLNTCLFKKYQICYFPIKHVFSCSSHFHAGDSEGNLLHLRHCNLAVQSQGWTTRRPMIMIKL